MLYRQVIPNLFGKRRIKSRISGFFNGMMQYHTIEEQHRGDLPAKLYEKAYQKIAKLSRSLEHFDEVDGRLMDIKDDSVVVDDLIERRMITFKSLMRAFIGYPSMQKNSAFFNQTSERQPLLVESLTQVSEFLKISAQQRKLVRQEICRQVTQHKIWTGAIVEILHGLKHELDYYHNRQHPNNATSLGRQIVSTCLKFMDETVNSTDPDSASWMKLGPTKNLEAIDLRTWEDVLEMVNDLIKCLGNETGLLPHVRKLDEMKEGLTRIRQVVVDRNIGYSDARHQEIVLQKCLSKALGHSSPCLLTLLYYYLYGRVGSIGIDVRGGILGPDDGDGNRVRLYMGKILTSGEDGMIWSGVKQLDKVLGLFEFVWKTAGMKGSLEIQGHLWCPEAEDETITYRGNTFNLHGIRR